MGKAILRTKEMIDRCAIQGKDHELWKNIYELMDGEIAYVYKSKAEEGKYVFCGLSDPEKNKDLFFLIEQDSVIGRYIDDWEEFTVDWEAGRYEMDGCIYLDAGNITQTEI